MIREFKKRLINKFNAKDEWYDRNRCIENNVISVKNKEVLECGKE